MTVMILRYIKTGRLSIMAHTISHINNTKSILHPLCQQHQIKFVDVTAISKQVVNSLFISLHLQLCALY